MFEVRVSAMLRLHLEAAGVYIRVPIWIAVEAPRSAANIKDKLITFTKSNLSWHLLIGPLVEADALQIK